MERTAYAVEEYRRRPDSADPEAVRPRITHRDRPYGSISPQGARRRRLNPTAPPSRPTSRTRTRTQEGTRA